MAPHPNSLKNLTPMHDAVRAASKKIKPGMPVQSDSTPPLPHKKGDPIPSDTLPYKPKINRRKYRSLFDDVLKYPKL